MIARKSALALALVLGASLGFAGCEQNPQPDPDKVVPGQPGLQAKNLREMTERMAPDLMQIPQFTQSPTRSIIVMKSIQNKLDGDQGRDLDIYVAKLKNLLNNNATIRGQISFVETANDLAHLQGEELGGTAHTRAMPQYALWGTFYSKHDKTNTYYLCTFRLTDLNSGIQVWENSYDVLTLN